MATEERYVNERLDHLGIVAGVCQEIAARARNIFGIKADQVHVDTTSFSESGEYGQDEQAAVIAITYGYSRDHRADLKQWMLALATTHDGNVPLFMQPLDGNCSDKMSLLATITAIQRQLREAGEEASVYVADNGVYSETNIKQLNQAGIMWVSRVSETLTEARTLIQQGSANWQQSEDGTVHWFSQELALPQGRERWVVVYTQASLQRAQHTLQRQESCAQAAWEQKCWHLSNQRFACEVADCGNRECQAAAG